MKTKNLFVAVSFILLSCMNAPSENNKGTLGNTLEENKANAENLSDKKTANTLKKHAFIDNKTGLTVFEKNFPSHWNVISKPSYELDNYLPIFMYKIQSDNGLIGFNIGLRQFVSYDDYNYGEMMKTYGQKVKPIKNVNAILDQELSPAMQKIGFTKVKSYNDQNLLNYMNKKMAEKGMANNGHIEVLITDWTNNAGKKAMTLLVEFVLESTDYNNPRYAIWNYGCDFIFAPTTVFNQEKTALLATATNYKENAKWEEYRSYTLRGRQIEADQKLKMQNDNFAAQNAAHSQRMANQKAQFDAHQNMMKQQYAANDANHEQYMNTLRSSSTSYSDDNSVDDNQRSYINMIREEQVVTNAEGKKNLVEAHSDRYWMNSNGEYIKTDDSFFNPNGDLNLNNQNWELVKKTNR